MNSNRFSQMRSQYQIVAVDDYDQKPLRICIAKTTNEVNELTEVIAIDLNKPTVYEPQKAGSYAKFMCPIRKILPEKDNIESMWRRISKLPEIQFEELLRITQGLPEIKDEGYLKYYDLEMYIFTTVGEKFQKEGSISAEDFFCIVIWKANRAKSNIAKLLLKKFNTLEIAVRTITGFLRNENISDYERFKYLLDNGFRLPMLSTVLTVLFPERFTIYDYRVCSHPEFKKFEKLAYKMVDTEKYWELYQDYKKAVIRMTPSSMNLRQKDQYLWGKSFVIQLKEDIQNQFKKLQKDE
jgi:hypothetical protein